MTSVLATKKHPLLRLLHYAKNYRSQVWTAATFTILNKIFDLAPSYLIGVAVDIVVEKEIPSLPKLASPTSLDNWQSYHY
jgi:ATP-binding cassette, subfamily B, bacterial